MPQTTDQQQYQYIKLPDGSYGKFLSTATDDQIRSAISKDFPDAFKGKGKSAPVPGFLTRVGQRIGSNIAGPLEAINKTVGDITEGKNPLRGFGTINPEYAKEVFPWGTGPVGATAGALTLPERQIGGMIGEDIHDPAKFAGDIATAAILHEASGGTEGPNIRRANRAATDAVTKSTRIDAAAQSSGRMIPDEPPVPAHLSDLTPAERAKYSKLSSEQKAKFEQDYAANQAKHQSKVRSYEDDVRAATDRANQEHARATREYEQEQSQKLRDYADSESKRRAEWARRQHNYNQAQYERVAAENKKQILETGSREYSRLAKDNLQSTHAAVREALDTRWNKMRADMQSSMVESPGEIYNSIKGAESEFLRGSPQSLQQFRNLIREMGIKDFAEKEDGTLEAITDPGAESEEAKPLPWETARVHYTAIGDRLASGNLPGNVYQALKSVQGSLDKQLFKTADVAGKGVEYDLLKQDWSQYMKDWKDVSATSSGGSPLARALRSPDVGYVYQQVTGQAGDRMIGTLAKYRHFGADPNLLSKAREFGNEARALKVPSGKGTKPGKFEPGTAPTGTPPELTLPKSAKFPEFERTPVPDPEAAKLPRGLQVAGRLGGKLAGAAVGGLTGHPFIGYAAGGETGEAIIRRMWESRHPKPGI